jgi:hypothetical protein
VVVRRVPSGRLVAIDGTRGRNVAAAGRQLARALCAAEDRGGVSACDASGIFTELAAGEAGVPWPSPRTLILLYAADLAFRLRWQIRPALAQGQTVIAAPYVQSAVAFGVASGLSKRWLSDLFRFAPKPRVCYLTIERGRAGQVDATGRYPEAFWNAIAASDDATDEAARRKRSIDYLDWLERRHRCTRLTARALAALGKRA